jgi:hypothetical protein
VSFFIVLFGRMGYGEFHYAECRNDESPNTECPYFDYNYADCHICTVYCFIVILTSSNAEHRVLWSL